MGVPGNKVGMGLGDTVDEGITLVVGGCNNVPVGISAAVLSVRAMLVIGRGDVSMRTGDVCAGKAIWGLQPINRPQEIKENAVKLKRAFRHFILLLFEFDRDCVYTANVMKSFSKRVGSKLVVFGGLNVLEISFMSC
jgi:hypothetical protein